MKNTNVAPTFNVTEKGNEQFLIIVCFRNENALSRMRTVHSSGHLGRGGVCPEGVCSGGCLYRGMSAWRGVCLGGGELTPPPMDRSLDTHLWKHYFLQILLRTIKIDIFLTRPHTQSGRWGTSAYFPGIHTVTISAPTCSIRRQYAHAIPHRENLKYDSVSRCLTHVINAAVSRDKNPFTQSNFILVLNLDVNETSFHSISHWQSRQTSQFYCDKWYFNQSQYKCRSFFRCLTHHMCVNPQCENNRKLTLIHYMTDLPAIN